MKIEIDIADQMPEIVDYIRYQTEIDFSEKDVADMFAEDIRLVADIAEWGWGDTEVRGRIIGAVTRRFLGRGWPTYGEAMNIPEFLETLKEAALAAGYASLPPEETGDTDEPTNPVDASEPHRWLGGLSQLSAAEVWAFTTFEDDVALRTKISAASSDPVARLALATMFPHGTASQEITSRLVKRAESNGEAELYSAALEAVIEEIAKEVLELCDSQQPEEIPTGAPLLAVLTHPDGREELLYSTRTSETKAKSRPTDIIDAIKALGPVRFRRLMINHPSITSMFDQDGSSMSTEEAWAAFPNDPLHRWVMDRQRYLHHVIDGDLADLFATGFGRIEEIIASFQKSLDEVVSFAKAINPTDYRNERNSAFQDGCTYQLMVMMNVLKDLRLHEVSLEAFTAEKPDWTRIDPGSFGHLTAVRQTFADQKTHLVKRLTNALRRLAHLSS
ncbi:hypothetical protein [Rhizobium sp. BK176]|uniref:hypothetical protein n=1 Tax=Rhizobium sp. BK176 TaxID=2587071 RepID=UPI002167C8B7|nr:hypothetical protein [Rhizobium sp. BK176]MCS4088765.1 hypothetical protein [Rhizobium sp. BK176]